MPFTISHTAAVLPFGKWLRRWKLLSAAVIGSMVPDFGVFMPNMFDRYETHGLRALFEFCLPVGLASYWLFQLHIKPATLQLMPDRLFELWHDEGESAPLRSPRQWGFAVIGILLGAITHLIWDGFTHENARGVRLLGELDGVEFSLLGHTITWYRLAQHMSSVVGLAFVLWFLWRALRAQPDHPGHDGRLLNRRERHYWFAIYVAAAVALSATALAIAFFAGMVYPGLIGHATVAAVCSLWGIVLSLIIVSAFVRIRLSRPRVQTGPKETTP
jgi:Domain of unknown function (DUF4184)